MVAGLPTGERRSPFVAPFARLAPLSLAGSLLPFLLGEKAEVRCPEEAWPAALVLRRRRVWALLQ